MTGSYPNRYYSKACGLNAEARFADEEGMRPRQLIAALFGSLLVAATAPAEPVPDGFWCGEDYWFAVDPPEGWTTDRQLAGQMMSLTFRPEGDDPPVGIDLKHVRSGSSRRDAAVDVEDVLEGWLSVFNAVGTPGEVRRFRARHPHLPTAGASFELRGASVTLVAIDARSGRGNTFVATLARAEGAPSPAEVAAFRRVIASIDFDSRRACEPGPDGRKVVTILPEPAPRAAPPAAPDPAGSFDLEKAASGCATLNERFVPLDCRMVELEGERALLAFFDEGAEPAHTYLERFTDRVAAPFCFESGRHPQGAPRLAFHAEHSHRVHLYDCQGKGLERSVPASAIRP